MKRCRNEFVDHALRGRNTQGAVYLYSQFRSLVESGYGRTIGWAIRRASFRFGVRMRTATTLTPLGLARRDPDRRDRHRPRPRRKATRDRLFIPSTAWPEFAAVVSAGVSGRSVGLWLAIRMQAKLERSEWVRVRTHLRESLGFTNRAAHSRAVTELERAGLIEVQRRKGTRH